MEQGHNSWMKWLLCERSGNLNARLIVVFIFLCLIVASFIHIFISADREIVQNRFTQTTAQLVT